MQSGAKIVLEGGRVGEASEAMVLGGGAGGGQVVATTGLGGIGGGNAGTATGLGGRGGKAEVMVAVGPVEIVAGAEIALVAQPREGMAHVVSSADEGGGGSRFLMDVLKCRILVPRVGIISNG